jgi:hypothetical protein
MPFDPDQFEVGDRVTVIYIEPDDALFYQVGNTGTIIYIDDRDYGDGYTINVQFDEPHHYLDGEWSVRSEQIRLLDQFPPMDEADITALERKIEELTNV